MIYTITLDSTDNNLGKGIDIALTLKKLGVDSTATGIMHKTREKKAASLLDKSEISHHFITPGRSPKISAATQQELLDYLKENLKMGDTVVIAGEFASGIDPAYLIDIATLVAKKLGYIVADVPYDSMLDILPLHPLLLKADEASLRSWFNKEDAELTTKQLVDLAHDMVARGSDHVLLSLGQDGAAIVNLLHAFIAPAPEVEVVSKEQVDAVLLATFLAGITKNHAPVRNLADSIAAACDTARSGKLTDFEHTLELQRQIMAEKVSFEQAR